MYINLSCIWEDNDLKIQVKLSIWALLVKKSSNLIVEKCFLSHIWWKRYLLFPNWGNQMSQQLLLSIQKVCLAEVCASKSCWNHLTTIHISFQHYALCVRTPGGSDSQWQCAREAKHSSMSFSEMMLKNEDPERNPPYNVNIWNMEAESCKNKCSGTSDSDPR